MKKILLAFIVCTLGLFSLVEGGRPPGPRPPGPITPGGIGLLPPELADLLPPELAQETIKGAIDRGAFGAALSWLNDGVAIRPENWRRILYNTIKRGDAALFDKLLEIHRASPRIYKIDFDDNMSEGGYAPVQFALEKGRLEFVARLLETLIEEGAVSGLILYQVFKFSLEQDNAEFTARLLSVLPEEAGPYALTLRKIFGVATKRRAHVFVIRFLSALLEQGRIPVSIIVPVCNWIVKISEVNPVILRSLQRRVDEALERRADSHRALFANNSMRDNGRWFRYNQAIWRDVQESGIVRPETVRPFIGEDDDANLIMKDLYELVRIRQVTDMLMKACERADRARRRRRQRELEESRVRQHSQ